MVRAGIYRSLDHNREYQIRSFRRRTAERFNRCKVPAQNQAKFAFTEQPIIEFNFNHCDSTNQDSEQTAIKKQRFDNCAVQIEQQPINEYEIFYDADMTDIEMESIDADDADFYDANDFSDQSINLPKRSSPATTSQNGSIEEMVKKNYIDKPFVNEIPRYIHYGINSSTSDFENFSMRNTNLPLLINSNGNQKAGIQIYGLADKTSLEGESLHYNKKSINEEMTVASNNGNNTKARLIVSYEDKPTLLTKHSSNQFSDRYGLPKHQATNQKHGQKTDAVTKASLEKKRNHRLMNRIVVKSIIEVNKKIDHLVEQLSAYRPITN